MTLLILSVIALACQVFLQTRSSMVTLNDGGYDDIVIAINPTVQEDLQIILSIQDMVKEASGYLFNATKHRLFFRSVKILIPSTWSNRNYSKIKTETYDKADVIIANPYIKNDDGPYTLQYGRCGEPGRYIHLTPNFTLIKNMINIYGPRGKVFLHEWAHLRWGVYDEYSIESPFYFSASSNKVLNVTSSYVYLPYESPWKLKKPTPKKQKSHIAKMLYVNGKSDFIFRSVGVIVNKTSTTKVQSCTSNDITSFNNQCQFLPNKIQFPNIRNSIMYMPSLDGITEFCNSSNHNIEAPNLQNRMCNSQSTWDIIKNSTDISNNPPRSNTSIPVPTFSLLQPKNRTISLVLDVSGSMSTSDRINRLYQATSIFLLQIIEIGSFVGIVSFSDDAYILSELVTIENNTQREHLKSLIPTTTISGTNICKGVLAGIKVNKKLDGSTYGTEILLLTDGEDAMFTSKICFPDVIESGVTVHSIALGPLASKALEDIADITGGSRYAATDKLDANGLIDAFSGLQSGSGDVTQQVLQLESTGSSLAPSTCMNGTVLIDSTVGYKTIFTVTWKTLVPRISIKDPIGIVYNTANFSNDAATKLSSFQIQGQAKSGSWQYSICNSNTASQAISIIVNSKAADERIPPITVVAHMNSGQNTYPNPMVVYASVSQGLLPVTGAIVTAIIETVNGSIYTLDLLDNGAGADVVRNDGIYSRYFIAFTQNGRYNLKVRVCNSENSSRKAFRSNRALYVPGYVENDTITLNPPNPVANNTIQVNVGEFSRVSSGGSFVVSNIPAGAQTDIYKPAKITNLEASIKNETVVLSWTATGDDMDQGSASSYELRMSEDLRVLLDSSNTSTSVNISSMTPKPSGSSETFTFIPENFVIKSGTILYFALIAIDKASQRSDLSNIAQAAHIIPDIQTTTTGYTLTTTKYLTDCFYCSDSSKIIEFSNLVLLMSACLSLF
ncbi:calcium-activated chloride channel regulator 1-like [Rhinoderma darwinii]|uniref:calcium-activated chloride channel regulator 1-like n=1 Tax=Rhinoderma darwinii TaxID=43563 RepID=UPI003F669B66